MTEDQKNEVLLAILMNEKFNRLASDLSDSEVAGYLTDKNVEDSKQNIADFRAYANSK